MEYKNIFEIEFIQRTQEIVNGYQIPFENTLFINACVGLLIIPQQSLFNHLPTEVVSADKWGIADTDISCIKEPNKSVKNVARHIRNAIAHDGIRFGSDNGKDITHIKITDWKDERHKTETFKAVIEVTKFKNVCLGIRSICLNSTITIQKPKLIGKIPSDRLCEKVNP